MGRGAYWIQRMYRFERAMGSECRGERHHGLKPGVEGKVEKLKSRSKLKLWMIRTMTTVLLWTCVLQLTALGGSWGPRVLKGWPSCFTPSFSPLSLKQVAPVVEKIALPPKSDDIFIPTYDGNMAKVVEGHRRYIGFKKTITLDRKLLVELIDQYNNGTLGWDDFSSSVKATHANRMGRATRRAVIPDRPKEEDYFYANPQECLQQPPDKPWTSRVRYDGTNLSRTPVA
ncbi:hypothetical protein B296_00054713 [Ensete ventricosum]|uniref:O-fucosyltransferase family protein n=1 Tax=Ensete ventricosum TaxID=4639 RepID=A0A426X4V9_ENSVE|nr:hypothetical protein B296_00054713 [Ensete ventricosum]